MPTGRKILLISGTSPGEPGVGGVILKDLVSIVGPEAFHFCWLKPSGSKQQGFMPSLSTSYHSRRYESGKVAFPQPLKLAADSVIDHVARPKQISRIAKEILGHLNDTTPHLVLSVLESLSSLLVTERLIPELDCPLHSIVWDDLDVFCPPQRFTRTLNNKLRTALAHTLKSSRDIAVISENMRDAYFNRYGVDSFILRHGVCQTDVADKQSHRGFFRIGFAGSITAPDCMQQLVTLLDSMDWKLQGKDICLRMLGSRFQLGTHNRQWIEYLGWREPAETRDLMADCDLLYLPQSHLPDLKSFSTLSFPTKLSTYIASRVPILLHAPSYASLSTFWNSYPMGPHAQETPESLQSALTAALTATADRRKTWLEQMERAQAEKLSSRSFEQGIFRITDVAFNNTIAPTAQ